MRRLVAAGCIEVSSDEYPKASLTELGREVMLAKKPLDIELPFVEKRKPTARRTAEAAAVAPETPFDTRLFDALRQWRRKVADGMGVPAFLILS